MLALGLDPTLAVQPPPPPPSSTLPPHHHYPLIPQHLLSCGLSRECPWTRSDLAASPQSDVIRLWKKVEKNTHTHSPLVHFQVDGGEYKWSGRVVRMRLIFLRTYETSRLHGHPGSRGWWHSRWFALGKTSTPEGIALFSFSVLTGRALRSDCKEVIAL